ncbi:unnamed protein product [Blepharisma stoltei]|uniref:Major facilitator superfamily (MFS) profile domain-containing protein n=1 Tax=Blepharisma stoltei TaxID=1481888 RepID=A0AAU9JIM3_9CILI|nr:unnamed protein product [Blepharisma stoltei]
MAEEKPSKDNDSAPLLDNSDYKDPSWSDYYKKSYKDLLESPNDYWMVLLVKTVGFGGFSMILVCGAIYLSEVQDISDTMVGLIYGCAGVLAAIYTISLSSIPDRFGIKISMLISMGCGFLGFLLLVFITDKYIQLFILGTLLLVPLVLTPPAVKLAIKKYTSNDARSLGFSVYTMVFYGSIALAGIAVDLILTFGDEDQATFRIIFIISTVFMGIAFFMSLFLRELDYSYRGQELVKIDKKEESSWDHLRSILILKSFWRLVALCLVLAFVRAVYNHLTITLPIYMYRDIEDGAHFGYIIALHQILMIIFTPILTMLIYVMNNYSLLAFGSLITAASPLVLLFGASYLTVCIFVFFVSLGEAIHAPRIIDYTMEVATKGREGVFLSVAASPLAVGYIFTGLTAGPLLEEYCPEDGERECWKVWLFISIITFIATAVLFIFRKWLEQPYFESHPYMSCSKEAEADKHVLESQ